MGVSGACGDSRSASAPWSVVSEPPSSASSQRSPPSPPGWLSLLRAGGAGHYVKMVHNGIEYGLMEAYGEGFDILHASDYALDLAAIARLWNHGSVIRSWLSSSPPMRSRRRGMTSMASPDGSPIPERDGGPSPTPWSTTCRHRSSPWPSSSASAAVARRTASPIGSSRLRNEFGGHAVKSADPAAADAADRRMTRLTHGPRADGRHPDDGQPLRQGLRQERMPEPCAMVICGATGDLTRRKLAPAIYNLALGGFLPPSSPSSASRGGR